jgi:5-methylcytosine-specific restriction endonuclease McrA
MDYIKLLKDSHWKKKRLKILKRDNYKCTVCGDKKDLKVHHTYYYKGIIKPWQYPDKSLLTVCRECHSKYHEYCEIEIRPDPRKKKKRKNVQTFHRHR